jgi:hypothetical protein
MTSPPFKFLFVDDRWIKSTYAVHRRIASFEKDFRNPVLVPDKPWEGQSIYCYGTCLEEAGLFRLWYQVFNEKADNPRYRSAVGYAESRDGLAWSKPLVGEVHDEYGSTNLVCLASGRSHLYSPAVIRDETDPEPRRRYKLLFFDSMAADDLARLGSPFLRCPDVPGWRGIDGEGLFAATSPDGIRWTRRPQPVIGTPSDASSLTQLGDGGFLATVKTSTRNDRHFRVIAESMSTDFGSWSGPRTVLEPDWRDPTGTEFYGLAAFEYWGNRLGLLWVYHNAPDDKRMDVQLAIWTSESSWQRAADRQTVLHAGGRGDWDAGGVCTASAPIVAPAIDPDHIWLFHGGVNVRHDDGRYRKDGIGLARLRLDGFAALEAGIFPGTVRTAPFWPEADSLCVNLAARHGRFSVTILDASSGRAIAGSNVIAGMDATALAVLWENTFPPLRGRQIVLEFSLHRASLYAFWFVDSAASHGVHDV